MVELGIGLTTIFFYLMCASRGIGLAFQGVIYVVTMLGEFLDS